MCATAVGELDLLCGDVALDSSVASLMPMPRFVGMDEYGSLLVPRRWSVSELPTPARKPLAPAGQRAQERLMHSLPSLSTKRVWVNSPPRRLSCVIGEVRVNMESPLQAWLCSADGALAVQHADARRICEYFGVAATAISVVVPGGVVDALRAFGNLAQLRRDAAAVDVANALAPHLREKCAVSRGTRRARRRSLR